MRVLPFQNVEAIVGLSLFVLSLWELGTEVGKV